MFKFKLFDNFTTKKKIAFIGLLIFALLLILGNYNREVIKSYISEVVTSPSIRLQLINIAKVAIPLKNLILMRNIDDKIALLKSSGSCIFCDLTQGNFKEIDLNGVDLRYAILIGANLSNANLSGANLRYANLSGVNLSGANLTGANLDGVDLSNKDLTGANLRYANLSGANLNGVDLSDKDLTGINLSGVDLSNKDLTGANLTNANLSGVNLDGVDLSNKDLTGVNLSGVDLSNKDLTGTNLRNTNLSGANLDGVDLSNKDLTGVNLSGVDLSNQDLTRADLRYTNLSGANLSGVDLRNKDLVGVNLTNANLSGANLSGVDLSNKLLTGANLTNANLSEVNLRNTNLSGANLSGLNLKEVNLVRANLTRANLTRTTLIQANLSKANLSKANLTGANLTGANLIGANLKGVNLTGANLKGANLALVKNIRPFAPTNFETTSVGDDFISVTWTDNAHGELGYLVYISSGRKPDLPVATLAADVTSYTFENLNAENYMIWIEAVGRSLNSDALVKFQGTKGAPLSHLKVDKSKGEWSLLVIPDTQNYVDKNRQYKAPLSNMADAFDWIVLIADDLNIKMVQGLGDITQSRTNDLEWEYASEIWYKLEGKVPFVLNIGNHDGETKFKHYFPESRFVNEPWWGGNFNGVVNSYQLMTIGNEDYLFANIDCQVITGCDGTSFLESLNWIYHVLDSYPDRKVILATHDTWGHYHIKSKSHKIRDEVIFQYDNIVLTNAGHSEVREVNYIGNGPGGGVSNNFVANYQHDKTEIMLLRFYVFKPLEDKVYFYTYSPITNEFEMDDSSQGSFDLVQVDP